MVTVVGLALKGWGLITLKEVWFDMQYGQSSVITDKMKFLQDLGLSPSDPANFLDTVLLEYRTSGDAGKMDLVIALAVELSAHVVLKQQIEKMGGAL